MFDDVFNEQRAYFEQGVTQVYKSRKIVLENLHQSLLQHESELCAALEQDLGKHYIESFYSEIGQVREHLNVARTSLTKWMKPSRRPSPWYLFARAKVYYQPLGQTLIISPYNYPLLLPMVSLIRCCGGEHRHVEAVGVNAKCKPCIDQHVAASDTSVMGGGDAGGKSGCAGTAQIAF